MDIYETELKKILINNFPSQSEMSEVLEISRNSISNFFNNKTSLKIERVEKLLQEEIIDYRTFEFLRFLKTKGKYGDINKYICKYAELCSFNNDVRSEYTMLFHLFDILDIEFIKLAIEKYETAAKNKK